MCSQADQKLEGEINEYASQLTPRGIRKMCMLIMYHTVSMLCAFRESREQGHWVVMTAMLSQHSLYSLCASAASWATNGDSFNLPTNL